LPEDVIKKPMEHQRL